MKILYSPGDWRPLGNPSDEPYIGVPRVLIFHTMSGFLEGSDSMFRKNGYSGTESHFGVGGTWDGPARDGAIWQWQRIDRSADAQFGGNAYATSIETSDGAHDNVAWSAKQIASLIKLAAWWCLETGNPAKMVTAPTGRGFGYHRQFNVWNKNGHYCPGPAREHQLRTIIVPAVAKALNQPPPADHQSDPDQPYSYHAEDGDGLLELWEKDTGGKTLIGDTQRALIVLGYLKAGADDGYYGPDTRAAVMDLQIELGLDADGIVGPKTKTGMRGASPKPKVPWPLPAGDYFGTPSPDPHNQSGFYSATYRAPIARIQRAVGVVDDGYFGDGTMGAVRSWQRAHQVAVTGKVDRVMWRAMFP